jgi:MFS family permease
MSDPRRTIVTVIALGACAQVAFMGIRTALVLHAIALGASTATVGLLQAAFLLPTALFSIHIGRMIDRVGPTKPMFVSLVVLTLLPLLPSSLPLLPVLFVAAALCGTAASVAYAAQVSVIGELTNRESRLGYMSLSAVFYSGGSFVGPLLAGVMIDSVGHRLAYLAMLATPLIATIVLFAGVRGIPGPRAPHAAVATRGALDLLRDPNLRAVYVLSSVLTVAWESFGLIVPVYGSQMGFSATTIGLLLSTMALAMLGVRLIAPVLARYVSPWRLMIVALLLASSAYTVFPLAESVAVLFMLSLTIGFAVGLTQPMTLSMLYELAPPGRGSEAIGLRQLFGSTGQVAIPVVFGALGSAFGMPPVFWTIAVSGFACSFYARGRQPRRAE